MPAHDSLLFKVPDSVPDELAVFADPFAVSLHAITRHPPSPGGKAMVYGAGALGTCAIAILRALYPDVEVLAVARFEGQPYNRRQCAFLEPLFSPSRLSCVSQPPLLKTQNISSFA